MPTLAALVDPIEHLEIGYFFQPFDNPHLPGHSKMQVMIHAQPTHHHYDPESIEAPIATDSHLSKHIIRHLAPRAETLRVCAGTIIVRDRVNKEVEAFSLGGELSVTSHFDHTICTFTSPAPIFDLLSEKSIDTLLVEEIQILLAERRAAWANHPQEFDVRLTKVDPLALYLACLKALHDQYARLSLSIEEPDYPLAHFLRSDLCVGPDGLIAPTKFIPPLVTLL